MNISDMTNERLLYRFLNTQNSSPPCHLSCGSVSLRLPTASLHKLRNKRKVARLEVFRPVKIQVVFWVMMLCSVVVDQYGNNVSKFSAASIFTQYYTASQPRRPRIEISKNVSIRVVNPHKIYISRFTCQVSFGNKKKNN